MRLFLAALILRVCCANFLFRVPHYLDRFHYPDGIYLGRDSTHKHFAVTSSDARHVDIKVSAHESSFELADCISHDKAILHMAGKERAQEAMHKLRGSRIKAKLMGGRMRPHSLAVWPKTQTDCAVMHDVGAVHVEFVKTHKPANMISRSQVMESYSGPHDSGSDEIIVVADTEIVTTHCSLGQVEKYDTYEAFQSAYASEEALRASSADTIYIGNEWSSGYWSHGNHVAATAGGNMGDFSGVSNSSLMIVVGFAVDSDGNMHVDSLLNSVYDFYDLGARVFSFSFNNDSPLYDFFSSEMDHFLYSHPEAIVFAASGNSGSEFTSGSPAIAKNVVSVGACTKDGKFLDFTAYGSLYGRQNPEVVHNGDVSSARSTSHCDVFSMQGTSMSTPIVSGFASVIRSRLKEKTSSALLGSTVRAALFLSAQPVLKSSGLSVESYARQGFGKVGARDIESMSFMQIDSTPFSFTCSPTAAACEIVVAYYEQASTSYMDSETRNLLLCGDDRSCLLSSTNFFSETISALRGFHLFSYDAFSQIGSISVGLYNCECEASEKVTWNPEVILNPRKTEHASKDKEASHFILISTISVPLFLFLIVLVLRDTEHEKQV